MGCFFFSRPLRSSDEKHKVFQMLIRSSETWCLILGLPRLRLSFIVDLDPENILKERSISWGQVCLPYFRFCQFWW